MHPLGAVLVAAAAACALARPPGPTVSPLPATPQEQGPRRIIAPPPPPREILGSFLLPRFLLPHYLGYDESPRIQPAAPETDWLNKEIDRISEMEAEEELINNYELELAGMIAQNPYLQQVLDVPVLIPESMSPSDEVIATIEEENPIHVAEPMPAPPHLPQLEAKRGPNESTLTAKDNIANKDSNVNFAMTPMDKEYYLKNKPAQQDKIVITIKEEPKTSMLLEPPRQTRQNPNLSMSKQKHLLEPDLGKLKTGLSHEENEDGKQVHMLESPSADPADSMYGVALVAAVGAALTMAIVGFAVGWYTLLKKAKAAADVDYPAYGVTGPSVDSSGDRKLAQSAHMYHYQHQKQQIIAMERNGLEQRTGSVSDPESEEENEEGDYTVYECPGFATTGDMEVKNPLFSDDPTPATPGKCEVVKPQPKD